MRSRSTSSTASLASADARDDRPVRPRSRRSHTASRVASSSAIASSCRSRRSVRAQVAQGARRAARAATAEHRDEHRHDGRGHDRQHVTRRHRHSDPLLVALADCRALPRARRRGLGTVAAGPVEPLARDLGRQVLLRHPALRRVVRIDVALSVTQSLARRGSGRRAGASARARSGGRARPAVARHRARSITLFDFGASARWSTACARLSAASGQPDVLDRARGGVGDEERLRVGEADVLRRRGSRAGAR